MNNVLQTQKIGIIGLGITGLSVFKYLQNKSPILWDDNVNTRRLFVQKYGDGHVCMIEDSRWQTIELLIVSPGVPTNFPSPHPIVKIAQQNNIPIVCDIDLLYQVRPDLNYIAITGTNGKSTTTALTAHILKQAKHNVISCGNIGVDALSCVDKLKKNEFCVVECSSFQLEIMPNFRASTAVLLNITSDHLDRYASIQDYIAAKRNIFQNQQQNDIAIINIDDNNCNTIYSQLKFLQHKLPISITKPLNKGAYLRGNDIYYNGSKFITIPKNPALVGMHNMLNVMAAALSAYNCGVSIYDISKAIMNFKGLMHRMEYLGEKNGIIFINDSKATNIASCVKALASFDNIIWIAGGSVKGKVNFDLLNKVLPRVKQALLIGESANKLAEFLFNKDCLYSINQNLEDAFSKAFETAKRGDVILLSPAYASFDQFKDFVERGEKFRTLFNQI